VWPYYQSQRVWNDTLEAIRKKFTKNTKTFAVAHQAPSRSTVQGRVVTSAAQELYIAADTGGGVVWQPALEFVGLAPKSK
jgi:hypothetical protein